MTVAAGEKSIGGGVDRLILEAGQDLEDLRAHGRIHRAAELAAATGEPLTDNVLPMYFTGRLDADLVLVHLNPRFAPGRYRTDVPGMASYIDWHVRYGHHTFGSDPSYRSAFDHKQVRFLKPFGLIDFLEESSLQAGRANAERAVDQKLQLELIPYPSSEFRAHRFPPDLLVPHFERVLDVIGDHPRQVVLFCGAVFDKLLERSGLLRARRDHKFRLHKANGELTSSTYSFSNLLLYHRGTQVRAGLARQFAVQGSPTAAYGQTCAELYNAPIEPPPSGAPSVAADAGADGSPGAADNFMQADETLELRGGGDFRRSDAFLVLRLAVRGLGENDSDEGSALERTIDHLAKRFQVDRHDVIRALHDGQDTEWL